MPQTGILEQITFDPVFSGFPMFNFDGKHLVWCSNRNDGGSGLGLAIAKSIIEMHKGKIWAESEVGQGLKVSIVLPLVK